MCKNRTISGISILRYVGFLFHVQEMKIASCYVILSVTLKFCYQYSVNSYMCALSDTFCAQMPYDISYANSGEFFGMQFLIAESTNERTPPSHVMSIPQRYCCTVMHPSLVLLVLTFFRSLWQSNDVPPLLCTIDMCKPSVRR